MSGISQERNRKGSEKGREKVGKKNAEIFEKKSEKSKEKVGKK